MMDAKSFLQLVAQMRKAQKEYFKYRSYSVLNLARNLERQVDAEIERTANGVQELHIDF